MRRRWIALPALALVLAGCLTGDTTVRGPEGTAGEQVLDIYEYRWTGDAVAPVGDPVGWGMRLSNPTDEAVVVRVETTAERYGPVALNGWSMSAGAPGAALTATMAPGQANLWLFSTTVGAQSQDIETTLHYERSGVQVGRSLLERAVAPMAGAAVEAGMHVHTATVGLWVNGTSFYTNIPDLDADEAFPAGYDRSTFDGTPLPVYVYDADGSEQPARSKDTCHFTTIPGYNALLKEQSQGSTAARFIAPEDAYTRQGNQDHFLYGQPLVFVNTVVAIEGTTGPEDAVPDPTAPCFDPENHVPPIPPVRVPAPSG